jgi:hypothetical protein
MFEIPMTSRNVVGLFNWTLTLNDVTNGLNAVDVHPTQIQVVSACQVGPNYICTNQPWIMTTGVSQTDVSFPMPTTGSGNPNGVYTGVECKSTPYEVRLSATCPAKFNTSNSAPGAQYANIPLNGRNVIGGQQGHSFQHMSAWRT